jgi:glycerol-3-phosphate dehydrogenase (NAD(P)+)
MQVPVPTLVPDLVQVPSRGGRVGAVAVMGAGSWGTAFALLAHRRGEQVSLWARDAQLADRVQRTRRNDAYLPDAVLPDGLAVSADPAAVLAGADLVVLAVPSLGLAEQLAAWGHLVPPDATIASLTKGLDASGARFASEVVIDALGCAPDRVVAVSGPNLAGEVAQGRPSATVAASPDLGRAQRVQSAVMCPTFRVYTNPDRIGVEVGGVVKNVLAIVAGAAHGLGHGDNTAAFLITRGLAEMTRLGAALGADPLTFQGLAGVGDLVATCTSPASRNRTVGERLGRGEPLDAIVASMDMVAEGVRAAPLLADLAQRHDVEMPMVQAVVAVTRDGGDVHQLGEALLARPPRSERWGLPGEGGGR